MKHIRPLTAFKKANPNLYQLCVEAFKGDKGKLSKKQEENEICYWYGLLESFDKEASPELKPLFFNEFGNSINKTLVTEIGRLLLTGWYYDIEEFTREICNCAFNDLKHKKEINELTKSVRHIRQNISYYFYNKEELMAFLQNHSFDEVFLFYLSNFYRLPEIGIELVQLEEKKKKENLKKDPDFYYKRSSNLEEYIEYLQDLLDEFKIEYLSIEEWQEKEELT